MKKKKALADALFITPLIEQRIAEFAAAVRAESLARLATDAATELTQRQFSRIGTAASTARAVRVAAAAALRREIAKYVEEVRR